MRILSVREVEFVSGGRGDVVVTAKKLPSPEFLDHLYSFMKSLSDDDADGGAGGGGEAIDNTPGYPVEHQKGLGISDYQEAWQTLLSKMSAAELTAFSGALAKAAADAKEMKEKGASDRLAQLAAAVLVGDSIGAAFASNQASDNLRGKSMALFEGLITKAYAAAAALPGGI